MSEPTIDDSIAHCVAKIRELVDREEPDPRDLLQLGYNLGRLSELTGGGRGPFWDRWKGPASRWDRDALGKLAQELPKSTIPARSPTSLPPGRPSHPDPIAEDRRGGD
ncbi:hypothetical protein [Tautonia sociabilis]|uniref:hypothetical protein n=1 Tax=Tautonia sociabilis TaxID=2080755 RepID=UPI0018F6B8DC|nr:hypothetical protein [Tautonia sociabilis]